MVFTDTKTKKNQIYSHWFYFGLSLRRLIFHDLLFLHVICLKFHSDWCQKPSSISVTLFLLVGLQLAFFFYNANSLGEKRHFKNTYSLRLLLNNLQLNWQSIGTWWHNIKRRELSQRGYKMKSVHLLMRDIYHIYFSFKMVKYLESYRSSRYKRSIIFSLV